MFKKQAIIFGAILSIFIFVASGVLGSCNLDASLINQDPYPAIPGDYVEVVFQLTGTDNPECKRIYFEIVENYPFSSDQGEMKRTLPASTYISDYKKSWMLPFDIRIDENALDGQNEIEVKYYAESFSEGHYISETFNISIEDLRVDFEIAIKDYDKATKTITFEILNIGKNDIEALTIEIPEQDNLVVKGSSRNIVGDLDSNEDTTFNFEGTPNEGDIELKILYTDEINTRRTLEKTVHFNPENFSGRNGEGVSGWFYVTLLIIALLLSRYFWKKYKKKRKH